MTVRVGPFAEVALATSGYVARNSALMPHYSSGGGLVLNDMVRADDKDTGLKGGGMVTHGT